MTLCILMVQISISLHIYFRCKSKTFNLCILDLGLEGERGLVAGRSQREKRRSYKDLLREEEEIAAQVRKSSKKRPKVC